CGSPPPTRRGLSWTRRCTTRSVAGSSSTTPDRIAPDETTVAYPFDSGAQLLEHAAAANLSIRELMLANERVWRDDDTIHKELANIWHVMAECVHNGCAH